MAGTASGLVPFAMDVSRPPAPNAKPAPRGFALANPGANSALSCGEDALGARKCPPARNRCRPCCNKSPHRPCGQVYARGDTAGAPGPSARRPAQRAARMAGKGDRRSRPSAGRCGSADWRSGCAARCHWSPVSCTFLCFSLAKRREARDLLASTSGPTSEYTWISRPILEALGLRPQRRQGRAGPGDCDIFASWRNPSTCSAGPSPGVTT